MILNMRKQEPSDAGMFYATNPHKQAMVGYLRGDFGKSGDQFWTTWQQDNELIKTQAFREEIDEVVNELRKDALKDLQSMRCYCESRADSALGDAQYGIQHGFVITTELHSYYLRCIPRYGDYNFYIFCYVNALIG